MVLKKKYALIFLSATLYAFSFLPHCWLFSFLFLIPLFSIVSKTKMSFFDGFLWAIVAFSLHLYSAFSAINSMVHGPLFLTFVLPFVAIGYLSFFSGLWFFIAQFFSYRVKNNRLLTLLSWALVAWLFFIFLDGFILAPLGSVEGCLLLNPLLPLVQVPSLLGLLPVSGENLLLLLLMLVPVSVVFLFSEKSNTSKAIVCFVLLPWIFSFLFYNTTVEKPTWLTKVAALPMQIESSIGVEQQMKHIQKGVQSLAAQKKDLQLVIMPESALYGDVLTKQPAACSLIDNQHLKKEINIVLGSFRWHENKFCNSFFFIKNGKIKQIFDKRHAMVLTERLPTLLNNERLYKAFYSTLPPISPSKNKRPKIALLPNVFFTPYICSELFFNQQPDDDYDDVIVLAVCNDKWCAESNVPFLMYWMAQFRALQWQRKILYVSYCYATFIDACGKKYDLF